MLTIKKNSGPPFAAYFCIVNEEINLKHNGFLSNVREYMAQELSKIRGFQTSIFVHNQKTTRVTSN
jgi:hypothetical protein